MSEDISKKTKDLIDELKRVCADFGLGNDGNESKIITQAFLYKFLNDKLGYELGNLDSRFKSTESWEAELIKISQPEFKRLTDRLPTNTARLTREQTISHLFNSQNQNNFSILFDSALVEIANSNAGIFSVSTASQSKITLFEPISQFVSDPSRRDDFCRSIINKLANFSFNEVFEEKFDFFATIFEYLIKDYNKDGGGKYAEYYTPHAVSKIMARILVNKPEKNVTVYDPSAGSGTLLMNVAHQLGESNCTIYSQDISQKSTGMLRLNLILNNLVHSIHNVIQGNTIREPAHIDKGQLRKFDFIVSNPPFKLDFSDYRDELDMPEHKDRFFAGVPAIMKKKMDSMSIYLLFIQHIIYSLSGRGKAAIVVPNGFLTGKSSIEMKIKQRMLDGKILSGVIAMPANIFANTSTMVSIVVLDKTKSNDQVKFIDASNLGIIYKDGNNKKNVLTSDEEEKVIQAFNLGSKETLFSTVVSTEKVKENSYSLNPGQYFEVPKKVYEITREEFEIEKSESLTRIEELMKENQSLQRNLLLELRSSRVND